LTLNLQVLLLNLLLFCAHVAQYSAQLREMLMGEGADWFEVGLLWPSVAMQGRLKPFQTMQHWLGWPLQANESR